MATRAETNVVYAAGLVQGIVLVTFPAASTIFTDPDEYDLSRSQYGAMFLPQVITAIAGALLGSGLARRFGAKRVYLAGLTASLVAMGLLVTSTLFTDNQPVAYGLLLLATACLGAGFGLAVPTLNTFTALFHPTAIDRSVLVLNALLGLGTALAPLFVAIFVGLGFWWGLPVLSSVLLAALLLISLRLPLRTGARAAASPSRDRPAGIPARFWWYGAFAVLYGICETVNGNWSQLDMTTELGASATVASLALTTFWAMVTIGRVVFASIQRWFPTGRTYHVLPFVLGGRPPGHRLPPRRQHGGRRRRVRRSRAGLLGAVAAHHQLRPGRPGHHVRRHRRTRHRRLPARLRHRRLRCRAPPGRRRLATSHLRHGRDRGRSNGGALLRHRPPAPPRQGAAPPTSVTQPATGPSTTQGSQP